MKRIFIAALLWFSAYNSIAQNKQADSLKSVLAKTTDPAKQFDLIVKIGEDNFNSGVGNIDSSVCRQLFEIARKLNNDSLLAISYNWIGDYFEYTSGDYITALEYFFKGIPLAEKVKDKRRMSSIYFDISIAYFRLQNPEESLKYNLKGGENLPEQSSSMYDFMIRQYQNNMAGCYVLLHQPDSALHYAQALNETNHRLKSLLYDAIVQVDFAKVYEALGEKEIAEVYYKKGNTLSDSVRFYAIKLVAKIYYTNFLLANNKTTEAREQARQLLQLGNQINNNDMKKAGAGFLSRVYDNLHQTDSAYYYSRMESSIKDSIFSQNNINKIQALAFKEQLRTIEETSRQAAETEQRKENIQYALIALGILSFIILFLLLSRSFITNTRLIEFFGVIALLIVFEFLNLLLHPFLEKVTHHSPSLMLLTLVFIAALLVPLHHKMEKLITQKLVEKNKQIRLAEARKTIEKLGTDPTNDSNK